MTQKIFEILIRISSWLNDTVHSQFGFDLFWAFSSTVDLFGLSIQVLTSRELFWTFNSSAFPRNWCELAHNSSSISEIWIDSTHDSSGFPVIDSESTHDSNGFPCIDLHRLMTRNASPFFCSNHLMTQENNHFILSRLMNRLWVIPKSGSLIMWHFNREWCIKWYNERNDRQNFSRNFPNVSVGFEINNPSWNGYHFGLAKYDFKSYVVRYREEVPSSITAASTETFYNMW